MLTPPDLGLPAIFKEFRPGQLDLASRIAGSKKRFFLLNAPTGTGKTLIMATVQKLLDAHTTYLCSTKQLQDQVCHDFPYAVDLRGRNNYVCLKRPTQFPTISAAHCTKMPERAHCTPEKRNHWCRYNCPRFNGDVFVSIVGVPPPSTFTTPCPCLRWCPYEIRKDEAVKAELAVLNLPFFLHEANYVGRLSGKPLVVLDEADTLEDTLRSFVELSISKAQIEKLELEPPKRVSKPEEDKHIRDWVEWAFRTLAVVEVRLKELAKDGENPSSQVLYQRDELERLTSRLKAFGSTVDTHWVFISTESRWSFKPVFVARYADKYIWQHGSRFLCMSATLVNPRQWARDLGIDWEEVEYLEAPTTFPVEHRLIHYRPAVNLSRKSGDEDWSLLINAIDVILDEHQAVRGLVHTVSYSLARHILQHSRHAARMVWHDSAATRVDAFARYKAGKNLVLVSPSYGRGISLDGDLGRFVIVAKVPYPDLGDKQIAARLYGAKDGKSWYATKTVRELVQATGRAVRSVDDWASMYVLDGKFDNLYSEWQWIFPAWWREALRREDTHEGLRQECVPT